MYVESNTRRPEQWKIKTCRANDFWRNQRILHRPGFRKSDGISRPPFSRKMDWQRRRRDWPYRSLNRTSLDFFLEVYVMYTLCRFVSLPQLLKELKFCSWYACVYGNMQILFTVCSYNIYSLVVLCHLLAHTLKFGKWQWKTWEAFHAALILYRTHIS